VRRTPRRGDVYWVALDPTLGSEIQKTRPAVIVSNNSCNAFGVRIVVLPLTSNVDSIFPGEALVHCEGEAIACIRRSDPIAGQVSIAFQD
jgi:mRNA interferase MazF